MNILQAIGFAAKTAGVNPSLLLAICMHETGLKNVNNYNDGGSHSHGVCQVKVGTAKHMGKVFKIKKLQEVSGDDLGDTTTNALAAAFYLKYQFKRYDGDTCKAVAAYNAGSFKESSVYPGTPFNWKYVKKVKDSAQEGSKAQSRLKCLDESVFIATTQD